MPFGSEVTNFGSEQVVASAGAIAPTGASRPTTAASRIRMRVFKGTLFRRYPAAVTGARTTDARPIGSGSHCGRGGGTRACTLRGAPAHRLAEIPKFVLADGEDPWAGSVREGLRHRDVLPVERVRVLVDRLDGSRGLELDRAAPIQVDTGDHAPHRPARQLDRGDVDVDDLARLLDHRDLVRTQAAPGPGRHGHDVAALALRRATAQLHRVAGELADL